LRSQRDHDPFGCTTNPVWQDGRPERDKNDRNDEANQRKDKDLVKDMERCPVDALRTYISNNWNRMNAAQFKAMDVDVVSARAEAQVRERTKKRFSVPGAWRQENLEGKATLRAIIDEGNWE
jgi:post-segregation antitoxin (ccd killing protein)